MPRDSSVCTVLLKRRNGHLTRKSCYVIVVLLNYFAWKFVDQSWLLGVRPVERNFFKLFVFGKFRFGLSAIGLHVLVAATSLNIVSAFSKEALIDNANIKYAELGFGAESYFSTSDLKSFARIVENEVAPQNADELAALGEKYLWGIGVTADPAKAMDLLEQSVAGGSANGRRILGKQFLTGWVLQKKTIEGQQLLETAIAAGDVEAKVILGEIYVDGNYLPRDAVKGLSLLESAAAAGNADAFTTLGIKYLWGSGVEANPQKSLDYLQKGVVAGSADARLTLGKQLITGWVLTKNPKEGVKLLEAAIALGDVNAKAALGEIYANGYYLPRKTEEGLALLESAAAVENRDALDVLGTLYLSGSGVERNAAKADDFLRRSMKAGNKDAGRVLGEALIKGVGVTKNTQEGLKLLQTAGENGDAKSLIVLGRYYLDGSQTKPDPKRGRAFLEKAAFLGNTDGVEQLGSALIWSKSSSDTKLAVKYLILAGNAGHGSAWYTLAQGAIFKKMGKGGTAKYTDFRDKARALKEPNIEVLEAQRWMWGMGGVKSNPAKTLAILEQAADAGNATAARYLIGLMQNGNYYFKKSQSKARAYAKRYGKPPSIAEKLDQMIQYDAPGKADINSLASMSKEITAHPELETEAFYIRVFRANQNLYSYGLQTALKAQGLYQGPLDGIVGDQTIAALQVACDSRLGPAKCTGNLLSANIVVAIISH